MKKKRYLLTLIMCLMAVMMIHTSSHAATKPGRASVSSVSANGNSVIFKCKKVKKAKYYQITLATNKKFSKNVKTVRTTSLKGTIYGLKCSTKYYVHVRGYYKKGNKKIYGSWSKVKAVKTGSAIVSGGSTPSDDSDHNPLNVKVKDFTFKTSHIDYSYSPQMGNDYVYGLVRNDIFGIQYEQDPYFLLFCYQKDGSDPYERTCYEWSTSNPAVATAEVGIVWIKGNGTCTITARLGKYSHSCTVTVTNYPQPATGMSIIPDKCYGTNCTVVGDTVTIRGLSYTFLSVIDTIPSGGYFSEKLKVSTSGNITASVENTDVPNIDITPSKPEYGYLGDLTIKAGSVIRTLHVYAVKSN